jgi:hypothetical protein
MTKKKAAEPALEKPATSITGCHFEVHSAANEHTRAAVVALAEAAKANANAIEAAALALTRSAGNSTAIHIQS